MLGMAVVERAARSGPVVASSRRSSGPGQVALDITNRSAVLKTVQTIQPSAVIHCAAETRVDLGDTDPDAIRRTNIEGTRHVAEAAAQLDIPFLYVSTDSVFDGQKQGRYVETDEPGPVNEYARTKLAGEREAAALVEKLIVVRTNIYGWRNEGPRSLLQWIVATLEEGLTVPGFVDVTIAPLYVGDAADLLIQLLQSGETGIFHAASSDAVSKFEFARMVALEFGYAPERVIRATVEESALAAPRPRMTALDPQKLQRALRKEMPKVRDGIARAHRDAIHHLIPTSELPA